MPTSTSQIAIKLNQTIVEAYTRDICQWRQWLPTPETLAHRSRTVPRDSPIVAVHFESPNTSRKRSKKRFIINYLLLFFFIYK